MPEEGDAVGWVEGDVELADARIHYYRRGEGPPVVLAHGSADNGKCWTRVAEQLEGEYELIAYDARGHGQSSDISPTAPPAGDDLLAVVAALALDRPVAMGHSMGAGAVSDAAARDDSPLRAAILEDPGWRAGPMPQRTPRGGDERPEAAARERVRSLTGWFAELKTMSYDQVVKVGRRSMPTWHDDELPAWAESKLQFRPADARAPRSNRDWRDQASAIRIPVLLVCGDPARALVDDEGAQEAQRLCPTAQVVRFDAGHNIRREAFEGFVDAIRTFLASVHVAS